MPDAPNGSARDFGRTALVELTPAATIGDPAGEIDEGDGAVTYLFEALMPGYPGWKWAATVAQLEGMEPTLLETELVPGEGSLLAPEWTPWSERMDDYRAAQLALGEAAAEAEEDGSDDDLDDIDDDSDDDELDDDFGSPVLHSGDLDGVDIDELDIDGLSIDGLSVESFDLVSAVAVVGVDEADQTETETGGAAEQPPRVARGRKRAGKQKQDD